MYDKKSACKNIIHQFCQYFVNLWLRRLFYRADLSVRKVRAIQGAMLPNGKAGESLQ
jgi:hypothetical protein